MNRYAKSMQSHDTVCVPVITYMYKDNIENVQSNVHVHYFKMCIVRIQLNSKNKI